MKSRVPVDNSVALAQEHYRAGRKSQAEVACRGILSRDPRNDQALQLLGVMALEVNRQELAVQLFVRALDVAPHKAAYYVNLGVALHQLRKFQESAQALRMAISLKPDLAEAHFNLALSLEEQGDQEEAFRTLSQAARLRPDGFDVQRQFARRLRLRREFAKALEVYRHALELQPESVECMSELSIVLRGLGQTKEAVPVARRAVQLSPDLPSAHNELGLALLSQGELDEAIERFHKTLGLDPAFAQAHHNLGIALEMVGRLGEAIESFRRAAALDPSAMDVLSNIAYLLPFIPEVDSAALLNAAEEWNRVVAESLKAPVSALVIHRDVGRRLRIGYVSSQFYRHCQSFFTTPLLSHHNHEKFEIVCYSSVLKPDEITEKIRSHADVWRDVNSLDDAQLAEVVRNDQIDILVDLTMHMGDNRLLVFAEKPAPVQICWLAYPGTTGLSTMDYRITDRFLDPDLVGQGPYSERSLVLPDTFWCYDPLATEPTEGPVPALANGWITFGCLNHIRKINEATIELWARVLIDVVDSRLILLAPEGQTRLRLTELFGRQGIDAARILFVDRQDRSEYLRLHQRIDICLDPYPYGGHTTSLDALWMGVPVVSRLGPTVVGRAALTIAANLNCMELVTDSHDSFVCVAKELAADLPRLQDYRLGLRARMEASALMDGARFARNIEAAYRRAWQCWCTGEDLGQRPIVILNEP